MHALTEAEVRAAFINANDEEMAVMEMPHDFLLVDWDYLDFFAWRDPSVPRRGYVLIQDGSETIGVVVRASNPAKARTGLCNICHAMQPGNQVSLFSARRAGRAGRAGDSVGTYICADLTCHDTVRIAHPLAPGEVRAPGQIDHRLDGTRTRMRSFVNQVRESVDESV